MSSWHFPDGCKRHTQDGSQIVELMKQVGLGQRPVLAIDVGCGDGIITHDILLKKRATSVVAFDVLPQYVDAAEKNLATQIARGTVIVFKRSAHAVFRERSHWDHYDRFVINPPFFAARSGRANRTHYDQRARHEGSLSLKVWARGAKKLLRTGGELYCVFPTERLGELVHELSQCSIEPKEIWWLKDDLRRRRVFLRGVRGARPGLQVHIDYVI